jgi:hypothetical protein
MLTVQFSHQSPTLELANISEFNEPALLIKTCNISKDWVCNFYIQLVEFLMSFLEKILNACFICNVGPHFEYSSVGVSFFHVPANTVQLLFRSGSENEAFGACMRKRYCNCLFIISEIQGWESYLSDAAAGAR